MYEIAVLIILIVLGLCMGSYAGATVWRLRARQLVEDQAAHEPVDKKELTQLTKLTEQKGVQDRSLCLHCAHRLAWYDLIPLVSWLSTGGKCRYCHGFIGWFEPLIELGTALLFVTSYAFWPTPLQAPLQIIQFVLWLIAGVALVILFAYDFKWLLLPNRASFPLIAVAALIAILRLVMAPDRVGALASLVGAVIILSGLYLLVWRISRGRWVGFGDVKLGLALALLLGDYQLAFIALFVANLLGCLIVAIALPLHKMTARTHLALGPLLIVGTVITSLWGPALLRWYFSLTF
jgi:prepilin signal peptidase PulO-like enzyme (type II secretory pathway)